MLQVEYIIFYFICVIIVIYSSTLLHDIGWNDFMETLDMPPIPQPIDYYFVDM